MEKEEYELDGEGNKVKWKIFPPESEKWGLGTFPAPIPV